MSQTQEPHDKEEQPNGNGDRIVTLQGMYEDYFLDYASYVILERAVPAVLDGLKPVQRRILHAMKEMDDGRYHKVANIIGQTMQYHPHGDAAIGDALVNLGQKDLLIDTQGNWGDVRTGDSAAASRYIEARLTKFALEVGFNPQTTEWQLSYDGRKKEPIHLPVKFPLLLAQGGEGIAVGLSTKILPHNFIELIKASIKLLEGKKVKIYPDFPTGGQVDVSDYQGGKRGGRVKVRARIEKVDNKTLAVRDLPYGVTTQSLIDSIIKANDKGKIKIKRVVDNTAAEVEIIIELANGVSPDLTIDALYAFSYCEVSIAPNACVIIDDKPHFLTVEEILRICTESTRELLRQELLIRQHELEEKLHFASLEKIFIEKRIYRDIEECETWEAVIETIDTGLRKYVRVPGEKAGKGDDRIQLLRDITEEDIVRLTEIKIKRISKFNSFKADELIAKLEEELAQVKHDLANLTDYAIAYYQRLLDKFGKGRERMTEITTFDTIERAEVVANNAKLYVDRKEGFVGYGLKKEEFVTDCSDIDDIIVFRRDGKFVVTRIADKTFVGKDIIHVDVWKKGDDRTTYNMVTLDGKTGRSYVKRFNVTAITRDREYDMTTGSKLSRCLYFSANPNGEAEVVHIQLSQSAKARIKNFDFDFGELAIKGRGSKGNILTRYPVRKITLKEVGKSTLGAMKVWMDKVSGRLNTDERGLYLGAFDTGDQLLALYRDGSYEVMDLDLSRRFEPKELFHLGKLKKDTVISAVYYEGDRGWTVVKRFQVETSSQGKKYPFITEHKQSKLYFASAAAQPSITYSIRTKSGKEDKEVDLAEFIDVKGWKSMGNKLEDGKISSVKVVEDEEEEAAAPPQKKPGSDKLHPGDSVDFDIEDNGQTKMF
ncbi:MAG: DNA gyrase/topoisomerase IV subunit A [Lewinella sp.]|nr:DNA gyrase/topoisomerase IV subunit A [Lewinella sp.]